jgi:3-dehydroquinate synthase
MVDSSIGGKTGVDIPEGKNLVGAFHMPKKVVRDVSYLKTLPERELMNGFAEMIKTAVLFDPEMFRALSPRPGLDALAPLIERCARWKERVVAEDFKEGGKRKLLNLGHTFGHAIESASDFRLSHGEAVAVGMRIVGRDVPEIGNILDEYGFPQVGDVFKELGLKPEDLCGYLANDKKRVGDGVTLVVPRRIGECELRDVPLKELEKFVR